MIERARREACRLLGGWRPLFTPRSSDRRAHRAEALGRRGERIAAGRLRRDGLTILARNRRIAGVEIDILALEPADGRRVLVEVKTGVTNPHPERRVDRARLRRLERAAEAVGRDHPVRIEIVAVDLSGRRPTIRRIEPDSADLGRSRRLRGSRGSDFGR